MCVVAKERQCCTLNLLYCCVYSRSADRGCSAPFALGSYPSLSPAPSAAAPGWPAALQCAYADGSYPADSQCTPTAGCLDFVEPGKKNKRSLHGVNTGAWYDLYLYDCNTTTNIPFWTL